MIYVVDACVAVKWVVPEALSERAEQLVAGDDDLLAPDLLPIEAANALWKKTLRKEISPRHADEALAILLDSGLVLRPTAPLLRRSVWIARRLRHPVYDCVYLALAEQERARMVTADDTFAGRVKASKLRISLVHLQDLPPPRAPVPD